MPKVYVLNQPMRYDRETNTSRPYLDLSVAEEFGDLTFVLPDGELKGMPEKIVEEMRRGLATFTRADYILLTGDQRAIAWGAAIVSELTGGDVPLLHWLRTAWKYVPVRVNVLAHRCEAATDDGPPRVYVVNNPVKQDSDGNYVHMMDLSPAAEHGELRYVLDDGELQGSIEEVVGEIHEGLASVRMIDHIVPVGDPRAIAWAGAIAMDRLGSIPLLHWVKRDRRYRPFRVSLLERI